MLVTELTSSQYAERIAELRARCLARKRQWQFPDGNTALARSLQSSADEASWQLRRGQACRDSLSVQYFELDELELLVGRYAAHGDDDATRTCAANYLKQLPPAPGQTGHCELDRERIFTRGIDGMLADIGAMNEPADADARDFRASACLALSGLSLLIERAGDCVAAALARERNAARCGELQAMLQSCRRIAHEPPATFRDAIQLISLLDKAVEYADRVALVVPGRLDRTLWPYYERDVAAGILTADDALALIECLYILINDTRADGLAMSVMVAGRDDDGQPVANALSYLCVEALRRTRLIYPTVGLCWHDDCAEELVDLAVELTSRGIPNLGFFGDETICSGLRELGVPDSDTTNYINSTCVEITPVAASNVWVASPYFNCCGLLLEEIAAQAASAAPAADFASFLDAYQRRLAARIEAAVAQQNDWREKRRLYGRKPLQSVFTRDCLVRGRDIDDGGARYNWCECSFVGLANLADSLQALRELLFTSRELDFPALQAVLQSNFVGQEALRQRCLSLPKYGNAEAAPDTLFADMVQFVGSECRQHRLAPDDSPFVPGAFCWIMHERLGRETAATPDGRRQGTPFADGCGPAQGREKHGPTAAILSTTAWDHSTLIGGAAFNMKFPAALFENADSRGKLRELIKGFLICGGFETQVNVVNTATLKQAQSHPDAYRDLVVRIGGYTDYFTRLSPDMQDEVILRTEYE